MAIGVDFVVNETVKSIRDHLNKAEKSKANTVERCTNYLEAVRAAINGLVVIYDEILVNTENCNLDDPQQVAELRKDIKQYVHIDRIRPELRQAVRGISNCHDQIDKIASERIQLPKIRKQREEVVKKIRHLLRNLAKQISKLESHGLQHIPAGTGIGIYSLNRIMGYLEGYHNEQSIYDSQNLIELVNKIRNERVKDELWIVTDQIVDTINDLYGAFG